VGRGVVIIVVLVLFAVPTSIFASIFSLGPEQLVQAGGSPLIVNGYSIPSYVDWNNDGRKDLVVGEGGGGYNGKVRIYLNTGTQSSPQFNSYFYVQSGGADLTYPGSSCLGLFPRVAYWDSDGRKDLIAGTADGYVKLFLNTGTDSAPVFDAGRNLQVGLPGSKVDIAVGARATPIWLDWNNDGLKDLTVGALDGRIRLYINEGTNTDPDFRTEQFIKQSGSDLTVPTGRSSPVIEDLDGDDKKDLLCGNTEGQLVFYSNIGTDASPIFSGSTLLAAGGVTIDLPGTPRSRPFVADWNGDGLPDVLVGAGDGMTHLYLGTPEPATLCLLGLGALVLVRKRR